MRFSPLIPTLVSFCALALGQPFPTLSKDMEADVYRKTERLLARNEARKRINFTFEPKASLAFAFVEVDTFEVLNPGAEKEDTLSSEGPS